MVVKGWCFEENGRQIRGVRARLAGRTVPGDYGWERLDVRRIFQAPPPSAYSGFGVALALGPGLNRVRLEADVAGLGWSEFAQVELTAGWGQSVRHRLSRAQFRVGAAFNHGPTFAKLTAAEREFLGAELAQAGGHPLRLSPHHAPRPVEPEQFPAPRESRPFAPLPKITVVTPSFQQRAYLEQTMVSVLGQEGVRLDYLVEDGGSSDGTAELLAQYGHRLKHWSSEPDGGQADALRRGFAQAPAAPDDIMAYLNSDDLMMPGAARFVADYFARHPEVDVVFGHRVLIDEQGAEVGRWLTPRTAEADLPWHDLIPQETLFWRRLLWDRVGGIDPSFQFALDWDLLLRFAAAGARFARLPWFLGLFRLHPGQKSQARLVEVGVPEMDRLRLRTFQGVPSADEMSWHMLRAQVDSARLLACYRKGRRD